MHSEDKKAWLLWGRRLAFTAFVVVILSLLLANHSSRQMIHKLTQEHNENIKKLEQAEQDEKRLRSKLQYMQTDAYVEMRARERLKFVRKHEIRFEALE